MDDLLGALTDTLGSVEGLPSLMFWVLAIFTRLSVCLFLLPSIGETSIPMRVRLVLALMITWILLPLLWPSRGAIPTQLSEAVSLIALEGLIGFYLGFSFRLMIYALQIVGAIVAQALSIAQVLGEGMTTEPNTTVSAILILTGTTLLITLDFHIQAVGIFYQSFDLHPLGGGLDLNVTAYGFTHTAVKVFKIAFSLAAPFILLNFIYNLLLGFVNRSMPQLLVSFVGMPAITGVGIVLLIISASTLSLLWLAHFQDVSRSLTLP